MPVWERFGRWGAAWVVEAWAMGRLPYSPTAHLRELVSLPAPEEGEFL